MKKDDLIGNTYGRYSVIDSAPMRGGHRYCTCLCACGNTREVRRTSLLAGGTLSCGCLQKEVTSARTKIHGEGTTRLFGIHTKIRHRCNNPNNTGYANYGAKGIRLCPEWEIYTGFRDWALANGYEDSLTIDRIDGAQGYFPENCRWVTYETQARNRRKSKTPKTSSYLGVSRQAGHTNWIAGVKVSGKQIHLGTFSTEIDAAKARDQFILDQGLQHFKMNF